MQRILTGIGDAFQAFFGGIAAILWAGLGGAAELLIRPFLGIFAGFANGMATGLNNLANSAFFGAGTAFTASWQRLVDTFYWFGFTSPVVTAVVVVAVLAIFFWAVLKLKDRMDDFFPEAVEKVAKDQDDE